MGTKGGRPKPGPAPPRALTWLGSRSELEWPGPCGHPDRQSARPGWRGLAARPGYSLRLGRVRSGPWLAGEKAGGPSYLPLRMSGPAAPRAPPLSAPGVSPTKPSRAPGAPLTPKASRTAAQNCPSEREGWGEEKGGSRGHPGWKK